MLTNTGTTDWYASEQSSYSANCLLVFNELKSCYWWEIRTVTWSE